VAIIHTKRLKKWRSFIETCLKSGYHPYKEVKKWRSFIETCLKSGYHPYKEVRKVVIIHRKMFKKWLSSIQKEVKK